MGHAVYFYEDGAFPDALIADFLWAGLQADESVVITATPDHIASLRARLAARGAAIEALERSGRLVQRDALTTLDTFMVGRRPDPARFRAVLGPVLDQAAAAAPSGRVRVYGECSGVLAGRQNLEASLALERMSNALLRTRACSVWCGYPMRLFAHESLAAPFLQICDAHDDIVPILTGLGPPGRHARCIAVLQQQASAMRAELAERRRTEMRLTEAMRRQAESERRKDEFLAMLGHELRNPLAPIMTAVELMELRGDPRSQRERSIIRRQTAQLRRLVDDLLEVSRITRGKIELRKETIEIADVLASAIESVGPLIEQHGHQLSTSVPPTGLAVQGDPLRLTQIFANLLTNAAKFTSPGGRITLAARRVGAEVVVELADNGCGIPEEMHAVVFEPFVQGARTLERAQGGLGLGLAMVKALTELHGGSVSVRSDGQGRGSIFTVRLPALATDGAGEADEDAPPASGTLPRQVRVLLVDDNKDAADTLADALREAGYDVTVDYDGLAALQRAEESPPDVALLDVGLPEMNGYELAARLRERHGDKGIRLIAMTGYGLDADRARAREAGFDVHLVKPVEIGTVLAAIDKSGSGHG